MKNEMEKHNITYNNNARENIFSQKYCKHVVFQYNKVDIIITPL